MEYENRTARLAMIEHEIARYCHGLRHGQPTLRAPVSVPPPLPQQPLELSPSVDEQISRAIGMRAA